MIVTKDGILKNQYIPFFPSTCFFGGISSTLLLTICLDSLSPKTLSLEEAMDLSRDRNEMMVICQQSAIRLTCYVITLICCLSNSSSQICNSNIFHSLTLRFLFAFLVFLQVYSCA
jgi:hypothetical protein